MLSLILCSRLPEKCQLICRQSKPSIKYHPLVLARRIRSRHGILGGFKLVEFVIVIIYRNLAFRSWKSRFKAQHRVVSDIFTILIGTCGNCQMFASCTQRMQKLTSFCFVWQSHITPSASHLPSLSGPSTAEPGKIFHLWFSEEASQFPELCSWWRCGRYLPKDFVVFYSILEMGFKDFFFFFFLSPSRFSSNSQHRSVNFHQNILS